MAQAGALPPPASLPAAPVDVFQAPSSSVFGAPAPAPAAYEPKGRPVQKTAAQKQALEAAFLLNQYPNEEARRALGDVIGLSEPQVNVSGGGVFKLHAAAAFSGVWREARAGAGAAWSWHWGSD
jgi:hypothetical protein